MPTCLAACHEVPSARLIVLLVSTLDWHSGKRSHNSIDQWMGYALALKVWMRTYTDVSGDRSRVACRHEVEIGDAFLYD
jgi:hypothetical protein